MLHLMLRLINATNAPIHVLMRTDTVMLRYNEGGRCEGQRKLTMVSKGRVEISPSGKLEEGERAQPDVVH